MTIRRKMALPAAAALLVLGLMVVAQSATATHVRPKAATPFYASLVPAYNACTSPNRTHAAPLSYGSCNPPVQTSPNVTVGTPDANGAPANFVGSMKMVVTNGALANDADVAITANLTDVRCQGATTACGSANASAGPDYTGGLLSKLSLRITDHNNAVCNPTCGTFTDAATGTFPNFPIALSCATTPNTTGSTCSTTTTANSLVPGALVEGKRAIVEVSQVQVLDGGPDGNPNSGNNEALFAVQGIFIP
jgi:hypothetical protein